MNQQMRNELQSLSQMANQLRNDEQKNARALQNLVQAEEKAQQDLNQLKQRLDQLTQDLQVGVETGMATMGTGTGSTINQMLQKENSSNLLNTTTPAEAYQGTANQQYGYGVSPQQGYYGDAYQQYTGAQYTGQQYTNQQSNTGQ